MRTKYVPQKNTLSTSERSDEKGLCVPKRLYFPQTIFTLKREESGKAKKKAEMRLIWWCYISCFNSPNQAPTLTPHYFSHHIKLLKNKNTVELSAQKWFQSSNFPPLLTLVSILNYTGNQRKKNRDRQKLVSFLVSSRGAIAQEKLASTYRARARVKRTYTRNKRFCRDFLAFPARNSLQEFRKSLYIFSKNFQTRIHIFLKK